MARVISFFADKVNTYFLTFFCVPSLGFFSGNGGAKFSEISSEIRGHLRFGPTTIEERTPIVVETDDHGYHGWHGYLEGEIDSLRTGITDTGYKLIRVSRVIRRGSPHLLLIRRHFGQCRR